MVAVCNVMRMEATTECRHDDFQETDKKNHFGMTLNRNPCWFVVLRLHP